MVESGPRSVERLVAMSPTGAAARAVVATGTEPGHAVPDRVDPVRPPTSGRWTAQGTAPSGAGPRPAGAPAVPVGPEMAPAEAPGERAPVSDPAGGTVPGNTSP